MTFYQYFSKRFQVFYCKYWRDMAQRNLLLRLCGFAKMLKNMNIIVSFFSSFHSFSFLHLFFIHISNYSTNNQHFFLNSIWWITAWTRLNLFKVIVICICGSTAIVLFTFSLKLLIQRKLSIFFPQFVILLFNL